MKNSSVLITGFTNPDLDAYACSAGYAYLWQQLGRKAQGACFGTPLEEVSFTLGVLKLKQLPEPDPTEFDSYIICDTSDTYHLADGIDPTRVEEVVDHHLYNDPALFPNAFLDVQPVGAAATLVVERFAAHNIEPSVQIAGLLYAAIISNSLNFKAKVTTGRDILAAAWVKGLANLPEDFVNQLFTIKSDVAGDKLQQLLRLDMNASHQDGKSFAIGQLEMVGAPQLIEERMHELEAILADVEHSQQAHVTFISLSDVDLGKTFFVAQHPQVQQVLQDVLNLSFVNNVAEYPNLILRKEYVGPVKRRALDASLPI